MPNHKFKPIKVIDMYNDCLRAGLNKPSDDEVDRFFYPPTSYPQFLRLTRVMEKAGYHLMSDEQVEQLKELIRGTSPLGSKFG